MRRIPAVFMVLLATLLYGSCGNLDTRPKHLGGLINVSPGDTATSESFRFVYAYRDADANTSPDRRVVQLKGTEGSPAAIISTCNSAGTGCFCDFYDNTDTLIETSATGTAGIRYFSADNTIACLVSTVANAALVDNVIIRNSDSSTTSSRITVSTSLTLAQIVHGLDTDLVRSVYRYKCKRNFLQKTSTTYTTFDCTDQSVVIGCTPVNITGATQANPVVITAASHGFSNGNTVQIAGIVGMVELNGRSFTVANATTNTFELSGEDGTAHTAYVSGGTATRTNPACTAPDLSLLHTDFTFFLYGGNLASNFSEKLVDYLYNNGSTGSICNMQVKQYDCVNTVTSNGGIPSAAFGLYSEEIGSFDTQITLTSSPIVGSSLFGIAASLQEFPIGSGVNICPPGLKRYDIFTTQIDSTLFATASNMPNPANPSPEPTDATDSEVWPIDTASPLPTAIDAQTTTDGDCDGTSCTYPTSAQATTGTSFAYAASGSQFCAIPSSLLP